MWWRLVLFGLWNIDISPSCQRPSCRPRTVLAVQLCSWYLCSCVAVLGVVCVPVLGVVGWGHTVGVLRNRAAGWVVWVFGWSRLSGRLLVGAGGWCGVVV